MSLRSVDRAWLALLVCFVGCAKKTATEPPPRLVEIRVQERGAQSEPPPDAVEGVQPIQRVRATAVDGDRLAARIAERFRQAHLLPLALGQPGRSGSDYKLTVYARLVTGEGDGEKVLRAFVTARLMRVGAPSEPPIVNEAIAEHALKPGEPLDENLGRAHLDRAVDDVVDGLIRLTKLHVGGSQELLAALEAEGAQADDARAEAIRVAALRKDPATVPALIALLRRDDPKTRDRALGALVEIGDRRAVKPITELARFQDVDQLPKVIDAMGSLGGDEARAYLEFVISAHDDEEMKQLARAALARLDRRVAAAEGSGAPASPVSPTKR